MVLWAMLDYQLVRAFAVVLEDGGFAKASETLCITQSAVSQRVKQLEEHIGRALVIREIPPRPTEAGLRLLRHYRQVLDLENETLGAIMARSTQYKPHVQIGVNTDSLFVWFMDAIKPFIKSSGITVEVLVDGHEKTIERLRSGAVAGCITSEHAPVEGCTAERIGVLRYRLVASADFAARWFPQGFTREAATSAPIVNLDHNDFFQYRILHQAFGDPQVVPPAYYFPIADQYFEAINSGLAYGLVPAIKTAPGLADGSLVNLDSTLQIELPLYWQSWKYQTELLRDLSTAIITEGARLLA
ncbi:MAG: LysR family transcriptional regulator ArgP [Spirochaetia bacterium]|nr:LysR family transcriptional regulator ArgP [Spirochaetia bacterium]